MMNGHKIVSREEWLNARKDFLLKEKEFTRQRDALSAARRDLPWVKIEKDYHFETSMGTRSLTDLFDNHPQLLIYHFLF